MALFKILKGDSSNLSKQNKKNGYCYFTKDEQLFYVDYKLNEEDPDDTHTFRAPINAGKIYRVITNDNGDIIIDPVNNQAMNGATLAFEVNETHEEIPSSKAVLTLTEAIEGSIEALGDKVDQLETDLTETIEKNATDISDVNKDLTEYKNTVKGNFDAVNKNIEDLQSADEAIEGSIEHLEDSKMERVNPIGEGTFTFTSDSGYLFKVDDNGILLADVFTVNADGLITTTNNINAVNGIFTGDINAVNGIFTDDIEAVNGTFSGDINANNGTFSGDINANNGTFLNNIEAIDIIANGEVTAYNVSVDTTLSAVNGIFTGDIEAVNATLLGDINVVNGIFSGNIEAVNGTFTGDINANNGAFLNNIEAIDVIANGEVAAYDISVSNTLSATNAEFLTSVKTAILPVENNDITNKEYVDSTINNSIALTHQHIIAITDTNEFIFSNEPLTDLEDKYLIFFNGLLLAPRTHYKANDNNTGIELAWQAKVGDICHIIGPRFVNDNNFALQGVSATPDEIMLNQVAYGISKTGEPDYITGEFTLESELTSQESLLTVLEDLL